MCVILNTTSLSSKTPSGSLRIRGLGRDIATFIQVGKVSVREQVDSWS